MKKITVILGTVATVLFLLFAFGPVIIAQLSTPTTQSATQPISQLYNTWDDIGDDTGSVLWDEYGPIIVETVGT